MTTAPSTPISGDLPRKFASRDDLDQLLADVFPEAEGRISHIQGGRQAADKVLKRVDAKRYARSRNHLNGAVTGLSPYIRHGVLTLAEVRDAVFHRIRSREEGGKLINELGWRDFWQRMWQDLGDRIHEDQEDFKTGHDGASYARELPSDVRDGRTGLACMDGFRDELVNTGWLHNHARMWLAAWLVHWRRVHWTAGANWFLEHLLDGDPASNHLSWQWVASTFSHKPYFFNRDNLERYSDGRFCKTCPSADHCPLEGSYAQLENQLFVVQTSVRDVPMRRSGNRSSRAKSHNNRTRGQR
ncbi:MAG: FAD-binding domain-containing protein [Cyanobacteriota bacterium]|nr:FAD-binding domain-containing protein [Cyanobacteriota bacterium]